MAVVVGHIVLISAQVNSRRGVPMLEAVTFGAFAEVQRRRVDAVVIGVRDVWQNYFALQQIRQENEELKRELAAAASRACSRSARWPSRRARCSSCSSLKQEPPLQTTAAPTSSGPARPPDFRTMTIDKGTRDGLRPDMAVIAPAGVVGRIILPTSRAAKVQLLIDRNAAAGALIERSRAQGVVVGTGTIAAAGLRVRAAADIKVGDRW